MHVVQSQTFRTDLAKKAYESTFEIERELRSTLKRLPPFAAECESLRQRKAYEDVIFFDFNFAHEQEIEVSLWKKVHYKTIEAYRSCIVKFNSANGKAKPVEYRKLLSHFTKFTKEASTYYRTYVVRLIVHFKIHDLNYVIRTFKMDLPTPKADSLTDSAELIELVTRSCHMSLIYLGDLSRYRELQAPSKNGEKNWGPAMGYYQFARKLLPFAGAPMNQLAVVAIYTNNVLGSTYFFLRAVCASEPFPTARENLLLGLRKLLLKQGSSDMSMTELFLQIVAGIYLNDENPDLGLQKKRVLFSMRQLITDRQVSADILNQLISINLGVLFLLRGASDGSAPVRDSNVSKVEDILAFTSDLISLFLDISRQRISAISTISADLSANVDPVLRRILPVLRISSRWIKINLLASRSLWTKYISAMTLCGSKFSRAALPSVLYPVSEDLEMRGFRPLEGKLVDESSQEHSTVNRPDEMLIRLSALLSDAAEIALGIEQELAAAGGSRPRIQVRTPRHECAEDGTPLQDKGQVESRLHDVQQAQHKPRISIEREEATSHASEPSMAFQLNKMVDSLVGQNDEEEEILFKGRKQIETSSHTTKFTDVVHVVPSTAHNEQWLDSSRRESETNTLWKAS